MKEPEIQKLVFQGTTALEKGRLGIAISKLESVVKSAPCSVDVHFQLALAHRRRRNFKKALVHAKRVVELSPREPNARLNLGVIQADLGNESQAVRNYRLELKMHPNCFEAIYNLGLVYIKRNCWRKACEYLQRCREAGHPGKLRDEYLALAAQHTRNLSLEEEIYQQRLKENPEDEWALNNLGAVRNQQGRENEAIVLFKRTLKINPSNKYATKNLRETVG